MKVVIIEKNTGSFVFLPPATFDYTVEMWEKAHKADRIFCVKDIHGDRHLLNSRRVIDIFEGELPDAKDQMEEEEDSYLNKNDQTP